MGTALRATDKKPGTRASVHAASRAGTRTAAAPTADQKRVLQRLNLKLFDDAAGEGGAYRNLGSAYQSLGNLQNHSSKAVEHHTQGLDH